ncbi:hypothetical protein D3C81_2330830 [compost metagenome]
MAGFEASHLASPLSVLTVAFSLFLLWMLEASAFVSPEVSAWLVCGSSEIADGLLGSV